MNTIKVKNITELKTRKGTLESVVEVLGYYTEGDGGGGTFYWNATSTATDNGGTIIQVTGVSTGRWMRVYSDIVSIKWFGAILDGITDDAIIFQRAINVQPKKITIPNNSTIRLNSRVNCNFPVEIDFGNSEIVVTNNIGWIFSFYPASIQSLVFNPSSAPSGFENGMDGGETRTLFYEKTDSLRLKNITIKNVKLTNSASVTFGGRLANFFSCDNVKIENCNLQSFDSPIEFWMCRNISIENSKLKVPLEASTFCLFIYKCININITKNEIENGLIGIEIKGHYPQEGKTNYEGFDANYKYNTNAIIEQNKFLNQHWISVQNGYYDNSEITIATTSSVLRRDWYGEVWNVTIINNTFVGKSNNPVEIWKNMAYRANVNARYCRFLNNTVEKMSVALLGCFGIEIVHNNFIDYALNTPGTIVLDGILIGGENYNAEKNIIKENKINSCKIGILINGGNYNEIIQNEIKDFLSYGVTIEAASIVTPFTKSSYNIIDNNYVESVAVDFAYPFRALSTRADYNTFSNNTAKGGYYGGNSSEVTNQTSNEHKKNILRVETNLVRAGTAGTNIAYNNLGDIAENRQLYYNSAPTTGFFQRGEIVWNYSPAQGSALGWVAIVEGNPATFAPIFAVGSLGNNFMINTSSDSGEKLQISGDINLKTAGNKLKIATGSNASIGTATLVAGTATVTTTAVTTNSLIFVTYNTPSGTLSSGLSVPSGSIVNGTSFVINSLTTSGTVNTSDVSTVRWWIIN